MKIIPQNTFSDDYAAAEIAHCRRRDAIERELLELVYAPNGNCREGVRIAAAEGVCRHTFLHESHKLLWLAAALARDTEQASMLGREALKQHGLWQIEWDLGHYDRLLHSCYWFPERLRDTARKLHAMERAEVEAKLCAARYRDLLTGAVAPSIRLINPKKAQVAA